MSRTCITCEHHMELVGFSSIWCKKSLRYTDRSTKSCFFYEQQLHGCIDCAHSYFISAQREGSKWWCRHTKLRTTPTNTCIMWTDTLTKTDTLLKATTDLIAKASDDSTKKEEGMRCYVCHKKIKPGEKSGFQDGGKAGRQYFHDDCQENQELLTEVDQTLAQADVDKIDLKTMPEVEVK